MTKSQKNSYVISTKINTNFAYANIVVPTKTSVITAMSRIYETEGTNILNEAEIVAAIRVLLFHGCVIIENKGRVFT